MALVVAGTAFPTHRDPTAPAPTQSRSVTRLDDTSWLRPTVHFWTRSTQDWGVLPEGDRGFETQGTTRRNGSAGRWKKLSFRTPRGARGIPSGQLLVRVALTDLEDRHGRHAELVGQLAHVLVPVATARDLLRREASIRALRQTILTFGIGGV
jgi:hypothetical protein